MGVLVGVRVGVGPSGVGVRVGVAVGPTGVWVGVAVTVLVGVGGAVGGGSGAVEDMHGDQTINGRIQLDGSRGTDTGLGRLVVRGGIV